jgi:hypothetical protein
METIKELTMEEMVFYADHALIDICDLCGNYFPITNDHDGKNYLTLTDNGLLCLKCRE